MRDIESNFDISFYDNIVADVPLARAPIQPELRDKVWATFGQEVGFALAKISRTDLMKQLGAHFLSGFLLNYEVVPYVEVSA